MPSRPTRRRPLRAPRSWRCALCLGWACAAVAVQRACTARLPGTLAGLLVLTKTPGPAARRRRCAAQKRKSSIKKIRLNFAEDDDVDDMED